MVAKSIEVRIRQDEALHKRRQGKTYRQIAAEHGQSNPKLAFNDVMASLDRQPAEDAPIVRKMEADRLDETLEVAWKEMHRDHLLVQDGRIIRDEDGTALIDHGAKLSALDRVLSIQARRAKLLGLDQQVIRHEVVPEDSVDAAINRLEAELNLRSIPREVVPTQGAATPEG